MNRLLYEVQPVAPSSRCLIISSELESILRVSVTNAIDRVTDGVDWVTDAVSVQKGKSQLHLW